MCTIPCGRRAMTRPDNVADPHLKTSADWHSPPPPQTARLRGFLWPSPQAGRWRATPASGTAAGQRVRRSVAKWWEGGGRRAARWACQWGHRE